MWYPATVTVAPVAEPVTLAEAKAHVGVEDTSRDTELAIYITAARSYVESYCGIMLASRTVTVKCDAFDDFEAFPIVPVASVSGIVYVDPAGSNQTLSTSVYEVRSDGLTVSIALKANQVWPSIQDGSRITVTASVGGNTPEAIKHALLLLIGQSMDSREPVKAGETNVDWLLANHRVFTA